MRTGRRPRWIARTPTLTPTPTPTPTPSPNSNPNPNPDPNLNASPNQLDESGGAGGSPLPPFSQHELARLWQCIRLPEGAAPPGMGVGAASEASPQGRASLESGSERGARSELVPPSDGRRGAMHVQLEGGERLVHLWLHEATRGGLNPSPSPNPNPSPITIPSPSSSPSPSPSRNPSPSSGPSSGP
jgi:hypothetical protein